MWQSKASYKVMEYFLNQGYHVIPVSPRLAGFAQSVDMVGV
ncbi:putative NAD(P)-binding enzyme (fragment) [Xenorhabdus bovienii str. oregonense]|uniref:Putative NAD(P)-binding enzyme n=1 Tax=Xenorhabdus bovienii str. oregonense TaxID=1398202 RepID=A0A077P3Y2_XENBV